MTEHERFWSKVEIEHPDKCWEWQAVKRMGYGIFRTKIKVSAHRYSWELYNGPIQKGLYVCHKCDNPACVNPDHLFLGSPKVNIQDCISKGRIASGVRHGKTKFSEDDILSIRREYESGAHTQSELGRKHKVHRNTIHSIVHRENWKYL